MHEQQVWQVPFGEGQTTTVELSIDPQAIAKELAFRIRVRHGRAMAVGKQATAIDGAIVAKVLSVEGEPRNTRKGARRK